MTTLTPKALRELIASAQCAEIVISKAEAQLVADAIEIADSCARADIECNAEPAFPEGEDVTWYDMNNLDEWSTSAVRQAARYLTSRGLLDRHPCLPRLVKPRSPE